VEEINTTLQSHTQPKEEKTLDVIISQLENIEETLKVLKMSSPSNICGVFGNWKQIAHFDTKRGDPCPQGFRTFTNGTTFQRACGRTNTTAGCVSVKFPVLFEYQQVCGIVKGYQVGSTEGFPPPGLLPIDSHYVDGVSITQGNPKRHLWTYAAGLSELYSRGQYRCPCARTDTSDRSSVPDYVGEHFYCESGFVSTYRHGMVIWDDPLWDGKGCHAPRNDCCKRFGWFHREVLTSSDDIELRICASSGFSNEDIAIESYEIWTM
jgi:dynein heavy chain